MMLKILNRFIVLCLGCCFSLVIGASQVKKNLNMLTEANIAEWQLVNINYLSDHSIQIEKLLKLIEKSKSISLKSTNNKLIINEDNVIDIHQTTDNLLPDVQNLLLQEELKRLKITDKEQEIHYFTLLMKPKHNNLNQSLLLISDYLFLFSNDEFILTFKDKQQTHKEFIKLYNKLNTATLPLANCYSPPEKNDGFLFISNEFNYFFKGIINDDYFQAIKLKEYKKIKLVLLFSYTWAGSPKLSIISFNDSFNTVDRLELNEEYELENGVRRVEYTIDKNYYITVTETEHINNKPVKLISKTYYNINDKGKFIKLKR